MSRSPQDFDRLGDLLGITGGPSTPPERLAALWAGTVGEEVARHTEPLYLRDGRLVVATSSSVWAQSLDLMGEQLRGALNDALGDDVVREIRFRPAGWDPGGARDGPRALSASGDLGGSDDREGASGGGSGAGAAGLPRRHGRSLRPRRRRSRACARRRPPPSWESGSRPPCGPPGPGFPAPRRTRAKSDR